MDSVKFHFPLQFYNHLIHQFWKNIKTGISWLSTSSAEPAFSKPCPCLSASNHRGCKEEERGRKNGGWREASGAHPAPEPPHRGATSFPGELQQLMVPEDLPKYADLKRNTHTKIIKNKSVSGINCGLPKLRPNPRHAGLLPPSRQEMARPVMCNLVLDSQSLFNLQNLFFPPLKYVWISPFTQAISLLPFTDPLPRPCWKPVPCSF